MKNYFFRRNKQRLLNNATIWQRNKQKSESKMKNEGFRLGETPKYYLEKKNLHFIFIADQC